MRLLLEAGADPNKQEQDGETALMIAIGANPAVYGEKEEMERTEAMVSVLLGNGADPNKQNKRGITAAMYASNKKDRWCLETVRLLLENGANPNTKHEYGCTRRGPQNVKDCKHIVRLLVARRHLRL